MKNATFFLWLFVLTAILTMGTYFLANLSFFVDSFPISLGSILFFTILTFAAHQIGGIASRSKNQNHLTQLTMILVFVKLVSCLVIVYIYNQIYDPTSRGYLILFFVIYLAYTVFEVIVLTKANRSTT